MFLTARDLFGREPVNNPLKAEDKELVKAASEKLGKLQEVLAKTQSAKNAPYYSERPPIDVLIDAVQNSLPYPDDDTYFAPMDGTYSPRRGEVHL
jgi:hypothetical protein